MHKPRVRLFRFEIFDVCFLILHILITWFFLGYSDELKDGGKKLAGFEYTAYGYLHRTSLVGLADDHL